jgi:hypothetical protein
MSLLPDTSALRTRALRLHDYADGLRRRATTLRSAAQAVDWVSVAASRFRTRTVTLSAELVVAAGLVEQAAAALLAHAQAVEHVEAELRAPLAALETGAHAVVDDLAEGAGTLGRLMGIG